MIDSSADDSPKANSDHEYNGSYSGDCLNRVAFPMGGIGAGMICLEGTGALSHVSLRSRPEVFNEPCVFAALHVKGKGKSGPGVARVLEGPVPMWKAFGQPNTGNGAGGTSYGLPRFDRAEFLARFPFGTVTLADEDVPLEVELTGWSPFLPGDADGSSLPVAALEYRFRNTSKELLDAVFSWHSRHFLGGGRGASGTIEPAESGFVLRQIDGEQNPAAIAFVADGEKATVDHCWFRGGWFDALTLVWQTVSAGGTLENPPQKGNCPGASLYVPFSLKSGEEKTVRLLISWYVENTGIRHGGKQGAGSSGPAFGTAPAPGKAEQQQPVSGFLGKGLVNTFYPGGDPLTGVLTSPDFQVTGKFIHFLIGGGDDRETACMNLLVDGKKARTAVGQKSEALEWQTWDVSEFAGKDARIEIVDQATGPWGHINVDHIVMTDAADPRGIQWHNRGQKGQPEIVVLQDFEGPDYGGWTAEGPKSAGGSCCPGGNCAEGEVCEEPDPFYVPWYAGRFENLGETLAYWRKNCEPLREKSAGFRDCFYDTTLPAEVIEAVAANLTILKTPTVLRQKDGRLWAYEGCSDNSGCCAGSCTHVWNYAQAIPHLFPALERTLRETEFGPSQDERGHQAFRSALPIGPTGHGSHAAADGQLGGIMKVHREWRVSGDTGWLKDLWPQVRRSLDYCIATWDPRGRGILEEPHHNTYDIEYWGPDGHCGSFYLGALQAAITMGEALGEDAGKYRDLLGKGKAYLESKLFDGEYFIQEVRTDGLDATFQPINPDGSGPAYRPLTERLNREGPKYQYGKGCLSDGVLGFWIARMCGLDGDIVGRDKIRSHLGAVHRYNLKRDLSDHANPQRPSYALGKEGGLLLCTWPKGGALSLPFVYSNEVWTGIEYQVAAHLMLEGMVDEGLEVVRLCRDRYDGRVRNPFDEYECGHWYARALASYGMLQGLTGVRFDAIDGTLHIDSRVGDDFRSFLSTATGFATVGLRGGKPFLEVKHGKIDVKKVMVSGQEAAF